VTHCTGVDAIDFGSVVLMGAVWRNIETWIDRALSAGAVSR
jgi:hypothetical protein